MKIPELFNRNELTRTLWDFRYEFMVAGLFSMIANLLMLTPTMYMLQVYDRVLVSQNTGTLMVVSLITLFLLGVLTFSEWARSKLLVSSGIRMDQMLSRKLFHASYEAYLNPAISNPSRAFTDLTELRQFLTGNGIFAFFDAPWAPIYIAVLFMLHPWLGVMALFFAGVQSVLAWWGSQATKPAQANASKSQQEVSGYLQSKFRNAEVIESMGMVGNLYRRWSVRNATPQPLQMPALELTLLDAQDKALVRRVFLAPQLDAPKSLASGQVWEGQLHLEPEDGLSPSGYRLLSFYP